MKTFTFILLTIIYAMDMSAQTTGRQFVEEGKYWDCGSEHWKLEGDTVINGTTYKKGHFMTVEASADGQFHYYCAVRQAGKKVYIVYDGWLTEDILFDFGLTGDECVNYSDGSSAYLLGGNGWDGCDGRGVMRHLMFVHIHSAGFWQVAGGVYWMEHIGCEEGPFWNGDTQYATHASRINKCYVDGECIFEADDIRQIQLSSHLSVDNLQNSGNGTGTYVYDLQGRRVPSLTPSHSPLKKGIYIENGRKRVVR